MESERICERCDILITSYPIIFPCSHSLCTACTIKMIVYHHANDLITQDQIKMSCPCKGSVQDILVADIPQILADAEAKSEAAEKRTDYPQCRRHTDYKKDIYCHDCETIICSACSSEAKHSMHKLQPAEEYTSEMMSQYPIDINEQLNRIEKMRSEFNSQFNEVSTSTNKAMDDLIKTMEESKVIYEKNMKEVLQRGEIILELNKMIYLELENAKTSDDIFLLQDLAAWNPEIPKLELRDETEKKLCKIEEELKEVLKSLPNDLLRITFNKQSNMKTWNKTSLTLTGHNGRIRAILQLEDGRIASGSEDGTIIIWEWKDNEYKSTLTLTGHDGIVAAIFEMKDKRLASASWDNTIKIWEMKEGKNTHTLIGHCHYVYSVIQLKDGRLASASGDNTIKIWQENEQGFINTLTLVGHERDVLALIQMKDGKIASASKDSKIMLWEEREKDFVNTMTLSGHTGPVCSLIKLEDRRIASGSEDNTIKIWERTKGNSNIYQNTLTLTGHSNCPNVLIQLKDGRLASGARDNTIKIWEMNEGETSSTPSLSEDGSVLALIQLKDGKLISASDVDYSMKVWE